MKNGQLSTCAFRKNTPANTLLYATSHHPHWLKNGIPVGQFLHIKRNCTDADDFRRESQDMYVRFCERGYLHRQIKRAKKKAASKDRHNYQELLTAKFPPMTNEPIRIITAFGSQWNSVCTILDKHWGILTNSPDLAKIVRTSPLLVARRARGLVDMLIQSEFVKKPDVTWLADYPRAVGMFPCNRCQICP